MRIFEIIYNLSSGGAERLVVNLCNELSKENDVFLLLIEKCEGNKAFYKKLVSKRIKIISLNYSKGLNFFSFFEIIYIIFKNKPDVVHSHLNTVLYSFIPSILFKKINFFHTLHSLAEMSVGFKCQKRINKFFYKKYISPIAISSLCAESFKNFYGLDKINVIYNAVPKVMLSDKFNQAHKLIRSLKFSNNTRVFICVGRLVPEKNHELLISAFNELIDEGNDLILVIIGRSDDPIYYEKLKKKSCSRIHFLGEKNNPHDYLFCSDCFVLSSKYEGLPMTILEAMSVGIPVVSTAVGGIPDVICESYLGVLCCEITLASFKDSIKLYLKNHKKYDKNLIIKNFKKKYDVKYLTQSHMTLFRNFS